MSPLFISYLDYSTECKHFDNKKTNIKEIPGKHHSWELIVINNKKNLKDF